MERSGKRAYCNAGERQDLSYSPAFSHAFLNFSLYFYKKLLYYYT